MCPKDINNRRLILEAAEAEFLDKGYDKARTTEIAKRAGVNHAMLHYYFRNKENLFNVVCEEKATLMRDILLLDLDGELPFLEKIKYRIEQHFDFIAANPKVPVFLITELFRNEKLRQTFFQSFSDKARELLRRLKEEIDREVDHRNIRRIDPYDLVTSIVSLNCFFFLTFPTIPDLLGVDTAHLLEKKKKMNVEIILSRLRTCR